MDNLIQEVFETIIRNPGIDAPEVCVRIHKSIENKSHLTGPYLAAWLSKHEPNAWNKTCDAVDELIADGQISFGDDGELRAMGY